MNYLFLLLLVPVLITVFFKVVFHSTVTFKEFGLHVGMVLILTGLFYAVADNCHDTSDMEIINGEILDKKRVKVSCSHSYKCRCYTTCSGSGSRRSCTEHCSTCYEHSYDVDWRLYTSAMDTRININRIDRQGIREPSRYTSAVIGDAVATIHTYDNYIKISPDSLFNIKKDLTEAEKKLVPNYPVKIYDYHRIIRVVNVDANIPINLIHKINTDIALHLRLLGPSKQVNIVFVITKQGSSYKNFLESQWIGGKKNDVIVVFGITEYPKIDWVGVISWTNKEMVKVKIRDDLMEHGNFDTGITEIVAKDIEQHFVRRNMEDFKYLAENYSPPVWVLFLIGVLSSLTSIGIGIFLHSEDIFEN